MWASVKHILIFERERGGDRLQFFGVRYFDFKMYIMHEVKFQKNLETVDIPLVGNSNVSLCDIVSFDL